MPSWSIKDRGTGTLSYLKNSGYIEKYQLYIPKEESKNSILSTTSPSYYGTSNNREFRHFFSVYFDSYQKTSYNDNKHKQWAKGLIDFSLIFAPKTLNIAYFALSATNRSDIISFETDNIRYDGSDEVTRHYITIQDITNTMGGGTDAFFVTIVDEARVNTTDAVIDYVSPTKKQLLIIYHTWNLFYAQLGVILRVRRCKEDTISG